MQVRHHFWPRTIPSQDIPHTHSERLPPPERLGELLSPLLITVVWLIGSAQSSNRVLFGRSVEEGARLRMSLGLYATPIWNQPVQETREVDISPTSGTIRQLYIEAIYNTRPRAELRTIPGSQVCLKRRTRTLMHTPQFGM